MTFTHILCPIDFSEESRNALGYAVAIGRRDKCSITGLHVYPVTVFSDVAGYPTLLPRAPDIGLLESNLRAFLAPTAAAVGGAVEALVEGGDPARTIVTCAQALPADLVVMGTHGRSGFERFALGSVTEKVLRRAGPPVLTVPPTASSPIDGPFAQVLCAVDFSPSSLTGLRYAASLAHEAGAHLAVVHVLHTASDEHALVRQPPSVPEYWGEVEHQARRELGNLDLTRLANPVEVLVLRGKPYAGILAAAAECHSDLIVLGIHARTGLDVAILGSTTNQVVRRASCPVLTVRLT